MVKQISKRVSRFYYFVNSLTLLVAVGFFLTALFTQAAEEATIGAFRLRYTWIVVIIYYVCSFLLLVTVCIGLCAQGKCNKPSLWVVYTIFMTVLVLIEISASGAALSMAKNYDMITTVLMSKMEEYNKPHAVLVRNAWNNVQIKYECCGVTNYSDWQDVQYGMTSLMVPVSCCLEEFRNNTLCGQNLLPDDEDADKYINTKGCLKQLFGNIDIRLSIMGVFGLTLSVFQSILVCLSCFLVITKKIF